MRRASTTIAAGTCAPHASTTPVTPDPTPSTAPAPHPADAPLAVVTGDTKVVPHGAADGLFINTTGLGELISPSPPGPAALELGDELIVSGPIGRHGVAVLAARELRREDLAQRVVGGREIAGEVNVRDVEGGC